MMKAGLFGGAWEEYRDALQKAVEEAFWKSLPPREGGASAQVLLDMMLSGTGSKEVTDTAPQPADENEMPPQVADVPYKYNTNPPSAQVAGMIQCIQRSCPDIIKMVTSTSEMHPSTDPHSRGLAADVTTDDPQTLMQCAAECGAAYQQDEYAHPSPNATGPHVHLQLVPGKGGAVGPYFPLPRPKPRPDF